MKQRHAVPGKLRAERLEAERAARRSWAARLIGRLKAEKSAPPKPFNPVGLKRQYVYRNGIEVLTPYYAKLRRRRRAMRRMAHESRRRNFA